MWHERHRRSWKRIGHTSCVVFPSHLPEQFVFEVQVPQYLSSPLGRKVFALTNLENSLYRQFVQTVQVEVEETLQRHGERMA